MSQRCSAILNVMLDLEQLSLVAVEGSHMIDA
jgi:hypothetical protein